MMGPHHQPSMKIGWGNAKTLFKKHCTDDNQEAETKVDTYLMVKPRGVT